MTSNSMQPRRDKLSELTRNPVGNDREGIGSGESKLLQPALSGDGAKVGQGKRGIFLVEDHPIARAGYIFLIGRDPNLFVSGESESAGEALTMIEKNPPALVIMDIGLKASNGLELIKNLLAIVPALPILVISMHDEDVYAERALRAGAKGYLTKDQAVTKIVSAIHTVLDGQLYLSDRIKDKLLKGMVGQKTQELRNSPFAMLSDREVEVYQLIGNGFTTREIALRLKLSVKTVDSYRENLKAKLGLPNSAELVRHAIRWIRLEAEVTK